MLEPASHVPGTPLSADMHLLAWMPLEILACVASHLSASAYINLSMTSREMRTLLRQPHFLRRVVACPQSDRARRWEEREADPLWEQLIIQRCLMEGLNRTLPPECDAEYADINCPIVSLDGRYVAWVLPSTLDDGTRNEDKGIWLFDVFQAYSIRLPRLRGQSFAREVRLHVESDLMILAGPDRQTLWDLNDLSSPIFSNKRKDNERARDVFAPIDGGSHLIVRVNNCIKLLRTDLLKARKKSSATVHVWTNVSALAFSAASPVLLMAGEETRSESGLRAGAEASHETRVPQGSIQQWNAATVTLQSEVNFSLFYDCLAVSDNGTRALAIGDLPDESGRRRYQAHVWTLGNPLQTRSTFDLIGHFRRFSLSPDGRYLVYTACKKNSARGVPEWPYPEWRLLIQDLDNVKRMPLTFVTNAYYPDVPRYYLTRLGLAAREIVLHCEEVLPSSQLCYPEENRLQIKGSFDNFWVVTADITYFEDDTEDGELDLRVVYPTAIRALASYG